MKLRCHVEKLLIEFIGLETAKSRTIASAFALVTAHLNGTAM